MKCPKCGNDSVIFGAFSAAEKLRAACLECYMFWEVSKKKITLKNLEFKDKRK